MINFKFSDAYAALTLVNMKARATLEASLASRLPHGAIQFIDDATRIEVSAIIDHCRESFGPLGVPAIQDRLDRFSDLLYGGRQVDWELLHSDLRVLREVLQDEMQRQHFYRYPANMASLVLSFDDDWKEVLTKFPSARNDAFEAVDCVALGKGTAAVFHLMRTLEHGLRALAKDVGKSFDVQNWQNIIEQIEAEISIGCLEIVTRLKVDPEIRRGAEITREAERRVGGDAAAAERAFRTFNVSRMAMLPEAAGRSPRLIRSAAFPKPAALRSKQRFTQPEPP